MTDQPSAGAQGYLALSEEDLGEVADLASRILDIAASLASAPGDAGLRLEADALCARLAGLAPAQVGEGFSTADALGAEGERRLRLVGAKAEKARDILEIRRTSLLQRTMLEIMERGGWPRGSAEAIFLGGPAGRGGIGHA